MASNPFTRLLTNNRIFLRQCTRVFSGAHFDMLKGAAGLHDQWRNDGVGRVGKVQGAPELRHCS